MAAGAVAATLSGSAEAMPASPADVPRQLVKLMFSSAAVLTALPPMLRVAAGGRQISPQNDARLDALVHAGAGFVFALGLSVSGVQSYRKSADACCDARHDKGTVQLQLIQACSLLLNLMQHAPAINWPKPCLAGMASAANVVAFLSPGSSAFDFSLAFVMAGAIGVAILPFQTVSRWSGLRDIGAISRQQPQPASAGVGARLLFGAVLFGVGWGLTGMCPGPVVANLMHPSSQVCAAAAAMLCSTLLVRRIQA